MKEKWEELYKEGKSVVEIARTEGVRPQQVYNFLKRKAIKFRSNKVTEAQINKIKELRKKGFSIKKTAESVGVSSETVRRHT